MIRRSVQQLHPYVPGEQPASPSVLKLNTNENPYPPSPKVLEALAKVGSDALRKYPHPTARPLCEAIAALHGVAPEQVIVGNGSDEILALCTRAFVEPGGLVGYMQPSYSLYPVLSAIADLRHQGYPLNPDFTWTPPASLDADFFFLTRPNAPTSLALPPSELIAFCARFRGVVLVDEAYADFEKMNALEVCKEMRNVLVSRTLSKSYSLAGIRLGYAVGPRPLIEALYKIKDSYNTNALSQALALAAVQDQDWMRKNARAICSTRDTVHQELRNRGWQVLPSQTNFLFARPPQGNAAELYEALRRREVYVRHFPGAQTGEYLRITIGTDGEMECFLAHLDQVV